MTNFHQATFDDFFMELINIGPAYISGWAEGVQSGVDGGKV